MLGPEGFTDAWERMGAAVKAMFPGAAAARAKAQAADLNLNVLSYYTDAGDEFTSGASRSFAARTLADTGRSRVTLSLR